MTAKQGKVLPPRPPPKQERRQLLAVAFQIKSSGDPAQSCVGLRHKIQITSCWGFCSGNFPLVSLRLWSCAGASTTHLGCSHDAKDDQASGTRHFHRCLATEILTRILNVKSVVLAAKSEHSDNFIQRWVEPKSSCRAYAHLPDITTSTSFQSTSGLLKSTNFASQEKTSDCYIESFVQGESQALSVNLPMLYRDIEFWKKDSLVYRWVVWL